ncbi:MAG: hypothetical protein IJ844_07590 [Prevotella sp.]|nr:hypothetical protein [Prevotella sp.]
MKKHLLSIGLALTALFTLVACGGDDDAKGGEPLPISSDVYAVGAGNYNENNGSIYNLTVASVDVRCVDIYKAQNGKGIGDAQDLAFADGKMFVTCTTSSKIEVLEMNGKLVKSISMTYKDGDNDVKVSPRYIVAGNDHKVYFTAYSGKLYKMDTRTYEVESEVAVGAYPEALSIVNGKAYVNLSDYTAKGIGKSVAVVDLATFTKTGEIEVEINPYNQSVVLGNNVYVVSNRVYDWVNPANNDNHLQRINTTTNTSEYLVPATSVAVDPTDGTLVCLYAVYGRTEKTLFRYNPTTKTQTPIADITSLMSPAQVNVDPLTGNIYVIDNLDYTTPCTLYVYDKSGNNLISGLSLGYGIQSIKFAN